MEQIKENIENPLLKKIKKKNPGQVFRLPSKGKFYTEGELNTDVDGGEVLVQPMSTLDEIYFRTPDMLYQGTSTTKVIERCIPQIEKPGRLLSKDIDYLICCLRFVSYGEHFTVLFDHNCKEDSKNHEYVLKITDFLKKTKEFDDELLSKLEFEVENFVFKTQFIRYDDMISFNQSLSGKEDDPESIYESFIQNLLVSIVSIDDIDDEDMIEEAVREMPRSLQMKIAQKINEANTWGVDFTQSVKCKDCGGTVEVPVTINPISFFTELSDQETQTV